MPPSKARPPALVTSSACKAAARARDSVCRLPISRNEVIDVSSQQAYRKITLSACTRPSIDPAKSTNNPARRPRSRACGSEVAGCVEEDGEADEEHDQ